ASAAEVFLLLMKDLDHVTLIGDDSEGSFQIPLSFAYPISGRFLSLINNTSLKTKLTTKEKGYPWIFKSKILLRIYFLKKIQSSKLPLSIFPITWTTSSSINLKA
ncbi:MAG: hypothetical protein AAF388_18220, partial [Bacteroidota bacterium]